MPTTQTIPRSDQVLSIFRELGLTDINPGVCYGVSKWLSTPTEGTFDSINPSTGQVLARVIRCSAQEYEVLIQESHKSYLEWRTVPAPKRGEVVRLIGEALRKKKDALGSLVSLEMGKIKAEGDGEVQEMIDMADFAVGQSRMLYGLTMQSERAQHRMAESWHPLGVVGVISAFNFPVAVWAWNAFLAAISGDTVVWKPSPKAPLCALAVQHICNQIFKDLGVPGIFSLLCTDLVELSKTMVGDERMPLISFTGSVPVGRQVAQVVAGRLGRSLLELSGNNAVIIDETADLELAIPAVVFGAVGTAGQRCTTTRRLFIHESRYEEVVHRLLQAYRQVRIGDPLDPSTLMGPLIDQTAQQEFSRALTAVQQEGGEILCGGHPIDGSGFFVEPTIVKAKNHYRVVQQETFAPILYVMPFKTLKEAIQLQNQAPQGLSSALFTMNLRHAEEFYSAQGSDCGIANVNIGTSGAEIGGAFGGEKETGGGREAGSDSWKAYMRRQTNTINWGNELPLAQGITFDLNQPS